MVGWFRRVRLPPPPLVLVRFRRPPLFFSLAFSGFARSGPGVLVLVFSPSPLLLLRSPSRVSVKRSSHLIFISISSSSPFHFHFHLIVRALIVHPPAGGCVCVKHLNRCKTSFFSNNAATSDLRHRRRQRRRKPFYLNASITQSDELM